MAASLGSDCPFFIQNTPSHATGRGEKLRKVDVKLSDYNIVIVNPGIHIDTAKAYSASIPKKRNNSLSELYGLPLTDWKDEIVNDFETVIFKKFPAIVEIRKELYRQGAIYSSMSGSGSSVYGIFTDAPPLNTFRSYWTWSGALEI